MSPLPAVLVSLHVLADLLWVGSIVAVAFILGRSTPEPKVRGELAYSVYKKLANPAFLLAFTLGMAQLVMNVSYYFKATKFMHGKLLFALFVIGLHHVIGARARKMAQGEKAEAGPAPAMGWALLACAGVAAALALVKPF
ncbi:MAG: hypothetical protein KIT72_04300 [Polyangiaceae bacterium]|nr:hypothetical protein [Polyangiaceae bacterium]MCW5789624.1 hypothetical protein [Polyangiaceae bacterium]